MEDGSLADPLRADAMMKCGIVVIDDPCFVPPSKQQLKRIRELAEEFFRSRPTMINGRTRLINRDITEVLDGATDGQE